jgi:hypothetical protein
MHATTEVLHLSAPLSLNTPFHVPAARRYTHAPMPTPRGALLRARNSSLEARVGAARPAFPEMAAFWAQGSQPVLPAKRSRQRSEGAHGRQSRTPEEIRRGGQLAAEGRTPWGRRVSQVQVAKTAFERLVEQTLELLRDEGLEHPGTAMGCGPFAYDAYQGCKVTDKHKEARVWLQLAHDESVLAGGEDGTQAQYYAELLERPLTADHHP